MSIIPISITSAGAEQSIQGVVNIGEGRMLEGGKKIFIGLSATNLGSRLMGLEEGSTQDLMKYLLYTGAISVVSTGCINVVSGIYKRNPTQILKGATQATMGAVVGSYLRSLNPKTMLVIHQASMLALAGGSITKSGISDFAQGRFKSGVWKIFVGASGIACAGFYGYNQLISHDSNDKLTLEQNAFLEKHQSELEDIYENQESKGSWESFGEGISKTAYIHPDLPDSLVKIPRSAHPFWDSTENDILRHHRMNQSAKKLIKQFEMKHIVIPDSVLINTIHGPIVLESKINLIPYNSILDSPSKQKAEMELKLFIEKTSLCDVSVKRDHNAGFQKSIGKEDDLKIGIFDLDCIESKSIFRGRRDPGALYDLSNIVNPIGIASIGKMSKEILGKDVARKIVKLGVIAGIAGCLYSISEDPNSKESFNMAPLLYTTLSTVGSTVSIAVITGVAATAWKGLNCLSNLFFKCKKPMTG